MVIFNAPFCVAYDVERTAYLEGLGQCVVRFSDACVIGNWEGVCGRFEEVLTWHAVQMGFGRASSSGNLQGWSQGWIRF